MCGFTAACTAGPRFAMTHRCADLPTRLACPMPAPRRSDCKFGTFDGTTCKCACMGEGTPGGYCPDPSTGECTAMCS